LYGTTTLGGTYDDGTVFELSPLANGSWKYTVRHNFNNADGSVPTSDLLFDGSGNLSGTTASTALGALLVEVRCSSVAHGRRNMDGNPEILLHSFNFDHISEPGI
jgi:uncharacterized repeat protein (TIGR03803 family)